MMQKGKYIRTSEIKEKQRQSMLGKRPSEETKTKMSEIRKRFKPSVETGKKISKALQGHFCSEETKNKISITQKKRGYKGEKNPNWKDGRTILFNSIKNLNEHKNWLKIIIKRDNYTCQECFIKSGKLHIHHIKPFSIILKEFLVQYNQFSPIDDKETLVRLAITYEPFWDINNGITLCLGCHKLTPNYKNANSPSRIEED